MWFVLYKYILQYVKLNNPPHGVGSYVKNSYKYKNIASIFFLVNILAFLYKSDGFSIGFNQKWIYNEVNRFFIS